MVIAKNGDLRTYFKGSTMLWFCEYSFVVCLVVSGFLGFFLSTTFEGSVRSECAVSHTDGVLTTTS